MKGTFRKSWFGEEEGRKMGGGGQGVGNGSKAIIPCHHYELALLGGDRDRASTVHSQGYEVERGGTKA